MFVLFMTSAIFAGCIGQGVSGKWSGKAETDDFTLTVDLDFRPNGTADYDIIKLRKNAPGLAEYFGTLNWTVDEKGRIILYETDITNPFRILEQEGGSLKWGTLYEGVDYVPLTRSLV